MSIPTISTNNAGSSLARGATLMMVFKLTERSIGLVSTLILARLLTPADFGLVAMAMSVVVLMELMGAFGFDVAIIQRQNVERMHYDTAWTFNVLFSTATAFLLLALALPAANFYHEARLQWMLPALAIGALAQGFENIGTVNFRKDMNFGREFRFLLSKKAASFIVTIGLALGYSSYWALVTGIVMGKLFSVFISYRVHPFRPRFSLAASTDLFHFSKWLFISNLVLFLQNKADNFILGRSVGAYELGLYNVANEIAVMPSTELIAPINRVVFPVYSRLVTERETLRRKFLEVFGAIALLAFPVSVGLVCVAETAIQVLLGPQWIAAVPLLQLFTVCGLTSALQSNLVLVIVALGQPKANTLLFAGMLILYLPALVIASVAYGTLGAAWVHLVMSIIVLVPLHIVFLRLTELPPSMYCATLWRPGFASLSMACIVIWLQHIFPLDSFSFIVALFVYVIVGALSYILTILALWHLIGRPETSAESTLLRIISSKLWPTPMAQSH